MSKPLKVLHINTEKDWRGGEQQLAYLITELDKKGVDNYVLCKEDSALHSYCLDKSIKQDNAALSYTLHLPSINRLIKLVKTYRPDIIHAHNSKAHSIVLMASPFFNTPIVVHRRVIFPVSNFWKYNRPQIRKVICISQFIESQMLKGVQQEKCITIYDGIDIDKFRPAAEQTLNLRNHFNLPESSKLIVNTSALTEEKDYHTFILTAMRLTQQRDDCYFLIVGDGWQKDYLLKMTDELNLKKRVLFHGFMDNLELFLPEADVFLFTSKEEGLGTSILNAMAAQIPVVATNAGGIPELVIPEKTGLLAEVGDARTLSKQVKRILENPELRQYLIQNAFQHVQNFSKEKMAKDTLKLYLQITDL